MCIIYRLCSSGKKKESAQSHIELSRARYGFSLPAHYNSLFDRRKPVCLFFFSFLQWAHSLTYSNMSNWSFCKFKHVNWLLVRRNQYNRGMWICMRARERPTLVRFFVISMSWGNVLVVFLTFCAIEFAWEGSKSTVICTFGAACKRSLQSRLHSVFFSFSKLTCDLVAALHNDGHVSEDG